MASNSLVAPFLGALQACLSVLLTLSYGVIARRFGLVRDNSIKDMSGLCVKVFFPALMIINLGSQLDVGSLRNYAPVLVWSIVTVVISLLMGELIRRIFRLPNWVTPPCIFNNTTSLPLLLVQSLDSSGSLQELVPKGHNTNDAVRRAQSYLLVCAVVNKMMAYAIGPHFLQDKKEEDTEGQAGEVNGNVTESDAQYERRTSTVSTRSADEVTTLLPHSAHRVTSSLKSRLNSIIGRVSARLPDKFKEELFSIESPFAKHALVGVFVGVIIGLVPTLHHWFFDPGNEGGIFNAWLTSSIDNIGKLFTSLQMFAVGCRLGVGFERIKMSRSPGSTPKTAMAAVFLVRFVIWPAISIPLIYVLANYTSVLGKDPILWFTMMLMPTGPPSLLISGLAELADMSDTDRLAVVKALTSMYAVSPVTSFTITGALKASAAAANNLS